MFPADFVGQETNESIRKALSRLVKEKILVRLGQGIYLFPKYDPELGILYPSPEEMPRPGYPLFFFQHFKKMSHDRRLKLSVVIGQWEADYATMRRVMIYGASHEFPDLMKRIPELFNRFRAMEK